MMRPVGWAMAQTFGFASASTMRLVICSRGWFWPIVDAGDDPIGFAQAIVVEIESAFFEDVDFHAFQHREAAQLRRSACRSAPIAGAADRRSGRWPW